MAFDLIIRSGDTVPIITKYVYVSGQPFNLTGYTGTFIVRSVETGAEIFNHNAVIDAVNGDKNKISYAWTDADTTELETEAPGQDAFWANFFVVSGSNELTIPNNRPMSLLLADTTTSEASYSGDPSLRTIDQVRFLLQDTNMNSPLFSDAEIAFMLSEFGSATSAASELAMIQSTKYADKQDKTVGPLSVSYGEVSSRWMQLSKTLAKKSSKNSGALVIMTQSSKEHIFEIGMHDNPNTNANIQKQLTGEAE